MTEAPCELHGGFCHAYAFCRAYVSCAGVMRVSVSCLRERLRRSRRVCGAGSGSAARCRTAPPPRPPSSAAPRPAVSVRTATPGCRRARRGAQSALQQVATERPVGAAGEGDMDGARVDIGVVQQVHRHRREIRVSLTSQASACSWITGGMGRLLLCVLLQPLMSHISHYVRGEQSTVTSALLRMVCNKALSLNGSRHRPRQRRSQEAEPHPCMYPTDSSTRPSPPSRES